MTSRSSVPRLSFALMQPAVVARAYAGCQPILSSLVQAWHQLNAEPGSACGGGDTWVVDRGVCPEGQHLRAAAVLARDARRSCSITPMRQLMPGWVQQ